MNILQTVSNCCVPWSSIGYKVNQKRLIEIDGACCNWDERPLQRLSGKETSWLHVRMARLEDSRNWSLIRDLDQAFRQGRTRPICQTTTRCLPFTGWYWALWKRWRQIWLWFYQVWFKEMREKRSNHWRGIVNNHVIVQNQRSGDPTRQAISSKF